MMKKIPTLIAMSMATVLSASVSFASITPPRGPGQIGLSSVVLCDSLSLHSEPGFESAVVQTVRYGDLIIAVESQNGWERVVLGDAEDSPSGWVNADFIMIDPAWYHTETDTPVYAWDDTSAPKVALLDAGTDLPILRDDGNWLIVSLRGATGWIYDPDRSTSQPQASQTASGETSQTTASTAGQTTASDQAQSYAGSSTASEGVSGSWFTVYTEDGSTVSIASAGGAMYEDAQGRTYVDQGDGYYYCITTDITYAFDPGVWTGAIYGENEFPVDGE